MFRVLLLFLLVVKAMDDIGVVMTPFGDVVTVILVVNSYVIFKTHSPDGSNNS